MTEQELLVDCLRRLNRLGLPYMLTGSMASNYWGLPRTTHDLDFVLAHDREHAPRIAAAFADDFTVDEIAVRNSLDAPYMFNAIDRRSALKADFWTLRQNLFERQMFERRLEVSLFGELAWIATAEDTVLHKLHWNQITPSERQLGDAAGIVAVQGSALDRPYLERWARELGFTKTLDDLLEGRIRPKAT
jgi:hypothetical protein